MLAGLLVAGCSSDDDGNGAGPVGDATYMVEFEATWSAATHPDGFPASAHLSGVIGATHAAAVSFWTDGQMASSGIESMSESGSKDALKAEVDEAIATGTAELVLSGGGIDPSPGDVSLTFQITEEFPRITLVSMVAPSPDWFVGVSGLSLLKDGTWIESLTVELFAYDAGTDSGTTYTAANQDTNPAESIAPIETAPFLVDGAVPPIGTFTFTLK
jgi:hypothetical protein